jgi:hypothetical protein
MENLENKIKDLESKVNENILIPRMIFWGLVVTTILGIIGNFIYSWNRVNNLETDIALIKMNNKNDYETLNLKIEKDLAILNRIENKLDDVIKKQIETDKNLILKKDKKFIE